jgi:hypothetical protein
MRKRSYPRPAKPVTITVDLSEDSAVLAASELLRAARRLVWDSPVEAIQVGTLGHLIADQLLTARRNGKR